MDRHNIQTERERERETDGQMDRLRLRLRLRLRQTDRRMNESMGRCVQILASVAILWTGGQTRQDNEW